MQYFYLIFSETSPKVVASDRRDINVRSQIGGHLCGIRYPGLVKLMGAMNLPSPIQDERYSKWDKDLLVSVKSFSDRSMKKAVEEAVTAANDRELMVSGDGFWQTRGFQSRHGAAALLSCNTTPKVLDSETCSKTCNVCMGEFFFVVFLIRSFLLQVHLLLRNLIQLNTMMLLDHIIVKKTTTKVRAQ